jgi:hypothetical protein
MEYTIPSFHYEKPSNYNIYSCQDGNSLVEFPITPFPDHSKELVSEILADQLHNLNASVNPSAEKGIQFPIYKCHRDMIPFHQRDLTYYHSARQIRFSGIENGMITKMRSKDGLPWITNKEILAIQSSVRNIVQNILVQTIPISDPHSNGSKNTTDSEFDMSELKKRLAESELKKKLVEVEIDDLQRRIIMLEGKF